MNRGRPPKKAPAAPAKTQQSWEERVDRFSAMPRWCLSFAAAWARQNTLCCNAGVGNFRALKNEKSVSLFLHGHHGRKATTLL